MSLYQYVDWNHAVANLLRNIELQRCALDSMATRIIATNQMSKLEDVQGNKAKLESELDFLIKKRELIEQEIKSFDIAWNKLDDDEKTILTELYIKRPRDKMAAIYNACDRLGCEQATVYRKNGQALTKLVKLLVGEVQNDTIYRI